MNKKFKFIFKYKKNYKFILYLLLCIGVIFFIYLHIPKFFNYTPKLVQESLKKNSDINIKHISNINYKFFPSPRLRLSGVDLEFGEDILGVENTEVDIILKPLQIINYKNLDYSKFLLRSGSARIELGKINKLFDYIKKNKNKINFKNNTIILLSKNKKLLEINDSLVKFNLKKNGQQLSGFNTGSDEFFDGLSTFYPVFNDEFIGGDTVNVFLFSISKEAFDYLIVLEDNTEDAVIFSGAPADPDPFFSNSDVLGYFSVQSQSTLSAVAPQ